MRIAPALITVLNCMDNDSRWGCDITTEAPPLGCFGERIEGSRMVEFVALRMPHGGAPRRHTALPLCGPQHRPPPDPNYPHADRPRSPVAYDDDHGGLSVSGTRAAAYPPLHRRPPLRRHLLARVRGAYAPHMLRSEPPTAYIRIVARCHQHKRSRSRTRPQPAGT